MLVRASLRWMVPVALAAAVLAPVAAAQLPGLGLPAPEAPPVPDLTAPSVDPLAPAEDAEVFLAFLRQWLASHDAPGQPEAPSEAQGQQDALLDDAHSTLGTAQAEAGRQAQAAQDQAASEAAAAQAQALQQVQLVQQEADQLMEMVPEDPVGFAAGAAQQAAGQAAQSLPSVFADTTLEPQAGGAQVVAPDAGLLPPLLAGSILVAGAAGATFFAFWLAGSSGTVASGAAAAAKGSELRRLLPFASPLFTRFEKETVLGHPRREALYALILQQPGISLQSLGESTGLSRTAVLHHLRLLEMQHLIVSKRMGRSRHYYENGGRYGRDAKEAYAILQNARSKEVADYIRTHPGAMQKQLCEALAIQPSIAHWHVRRLQAAQLVECVRQGRAVNYFPGRGLLEVASHAAIPQLPELPPEVPAAPVPLASTPMGV